jgi:hypothetical protein
VSKQSSQPLDVIQTAFEHYCAGRDKFTTPCAKERDAFVSGWISGITLVETLVSRIADGEALFVEPM